jgi:hypothetical protein
MKKCAYPVGLLLGLVVSIANGEPPVVTLAGDAVVSVDVGTTFTELGATATDAEDGDIAQIQTEYFPPGVPVRMIVREGDIQAWWRFDETSGTAAADWTNNGHNGVLTGSADWGEGVDGGGIHLAGGYVSVGSMDVLDGKDAATYTFWAKQDSLTTGQYVLWHGNRHLLEFGDSFSTNKPADVRVRWHLGGGFANTHTAVGTAEVDVWHHWAFSFGLKATKIYRDGQEVYSGTDTQSAFSTGVQTTYIGYRPSSTTFMGSLDDLRLYRVALSAGEVAEVYGDGEGDWPNGVVDNVDTNVLGKWTGFYSATDSDGNKAAITRAINVTDPLAPVIEWTAAQQFTHEKGTVFALPQVTIKTFNGNVIDGAEPVVTGAVDVGAEGVYPLRLDYTDAGGHIAWAVELEVTVVDTLPPVLTLSGGDLIKVNLGSKFVDPGILSLDAGDGKLSASSSLMDWGKLMHYGFSGGFSEIVLDFNQNGGLMSDAKVGEAVFTSGPSGRGIDFQNDQDFLDAGVGLNGTDNFRSLFLGYFHAQKDGDYEFGIAANDDRGSFWLDLDQDEVFESAGDRGVEWMNGGFTAGHTVVHLDAGVYRVAIGHMVGSGNSVVRADFRTPPGAGPEVLTTVNPADPAQENLWGLRVPVDTTTSGTFGISYSSTDSYGFTSTAVRQVVVGSYENLPRIEVEGPPSIVHQAGKLFTPPSATVLDAAGNPLDATKLIINGIVVEDAPGNYSLVYHYVDADGLMAKPVTVPVRVKDTLPPVLTLIGDASIEYIIGTAFVDPGYEASDNFDPAPVVASNAQFPQANLWLHLDASSLAGTTDGAPVIDWPDLSGNANNANVPNGVPTFAKAALNGLPAVHFDGNSSLSVQGYTYNVYSILTVSQLDGRLNQRLLTTSDADWALGYYGGYEDIFYPATWLVPRAKLATNLPHLYTAISTGNTDSRLYAEGNWMVGRTSGNSVMGTFQMGAFKKNLQVPSVGDVAEVLIYDRDLSLKERLDAEACLGVKYGLAGYPQGAPVDLTAPGTYTIVYSAKDTSGNMVFATREVVVKEPDFPTGLVLLGQSTLLHELGTDFTDPGFEYYDGQGSLVPTPPVLVQGTVDKDAAATYVIDYLPDTAQGADFPVQSRKVIVADRQAPDFSFPGGDVVRVLKDSAYTDVSPTVSDAVDGDLSGAVTVQFPDVLGTGDPGVDTSVLGQHTIVYSVSDAVGNVAKATKAVIVSEDSSMVATQLADYEMEAAGNWVKKLPEGDGRQKAMSTIIRELANDSTESAKEWLMSLPEKDRYAGMPELIRKWANEDPGSAGEWLNQFPPSEQMDKAVSTYVRAIRRGDPAAAKDWASSIVNEDTRKKVVESIDRPPNSFRFDGGEVKVEGDVGIDVKGSTIRVTTE